MHCLHCTTYIYTYIVYIHCIIYVALIAFYPSHSPPPQNTVDILVGWHIDIQQESSLIDFIATSLVSLHEFWIKDMPFSVELLKQFLEDMEAYSNVSKDAENVCCCNSVVEGRSSK